MKKILTIAALTVMTMSSGFAASKTITHNIEETKKASNAFSNHTDGVRISMGFSVLNYSKAKSNSGEWDLNSNDNSAYSDSVSTHVPLEFKIEKSFSVNHRLSTSTALRYATAGSSTESKGDYNESSWNREKLETKYNEYGLEQRIHLNLGNGPRFRPFIAFQVGITSIKTKDMDSSNYLELKGIHTNIKTGGELCWKSGWYIETSIAYTRFNVNKISDNDESTSETNNLKLTGFNAGFNFGFAF
ncbi:hypothetical protein A9Q84_04135 [Halobacteriovorax marinus]|uniref:Outer membrane protein beta-barrel domain-containing protein n=1 Tax=Halobacteriovorax marinus TaxID=97084 RepID=A0A1Y5FFX7_9BACT|nr:hypothetical protein A9Q84_04135 [Halobacteriovorax marinus]